MLPRRLRRKPHLMPKAIYERGTLGGNPVRLAHRLDAAGGWEGPGVSSA